MIGRIGHNVLMSADVEAVRDALGEVQARAVDLRWAEERPWRVESHVHDEFGVVTIDLHDLNAALTKRALRAVVALAEMLSGGGVIFITGQGRHSVGLPVLRRIVLGSLVRLERDRGWRVRDCGAGRILLIVDEARIPARYRADMPLWIPGFFVAFGVALAWTLPTAVGVPLLAVIIWFAVGVVRQAIWPRSPTAAVSPEE